MDLKEHFREVMRAKTTPHSLALGFAIGTVLGMSPIPGFHILLALLIIFIFEKVSKITLFFALAVYNPFVLAPIYYFSLKLGLFLFRNANAANYNFINYTMIFLIGNFIISLGMSLIGYALVYFVVKRFKR